VTANLREDVMADLAAVLGGGEPLLGADPAVERAVVKGHSRDGDVIIGRTNCGPRREPPNQRQLGMFPCPHCGVAGNASNPHWCPHQKACDPSLPPNCSECLVLHGLNFGRELEETRGGES
jgi:hypothetical protein